MGLFRISRPVVVDARQCTEAGTIATDLGFINVKHGDWIIRGEDGETYILNNDFFQRTFSPVQQRQSSPDEHGAQNLNPAAIIEEHPRQLPLNREHRRAQLRSGPLTDPRLRTH